MKRQMLIAVLVVGIALLAALPALADPPVHSVHVGGPDFCAAYDLQPGCDKNVAIHAVKDGNGEVTGQWDDRWAFDWGGFHATIDCLEIEGNEAWVSGVITKGIFNDGSEVFDLKGLRVSSRVRDNGKTANDPADEISWVVGADTPDFKECNEKPDYALWEMPQGQVIVR